MDSTYYLEKATKETFACLLYFVIPYLTSITIDANLIELPASIFAIMNYLCYIISFVFLLSSIRNLLYMHSNPHKKEPASTTRTQIKIPTQNKKETLDKIVNF